VTWNPSYQNTLDAFGSNTHGTSVQQVGDGSTQWPRQPATDITQTYDADGRPGTRTQITRQDDRDPETGEYYGVSTDTLTSHYVHSSVLGERVVEIDGSGNVNVWVYAGGQRIATAIAGAYGNTTFEQHNPVTGSWVQTNGHSSNRAATRQERDPMDAQLPLTNPGGAAYAAQNPNQPLFVIGGDPGDLSGGCVLDGLPTACSFVRGNAAERCPDNDCGPRTVWVDIKGDDLRLALGLTSGGTFTDPFTAYADGSSGFGFQGGLLPPEGISMTFTGSQVMAALVDFFSMSMQQKPGKRRRKSKRTQPSNVGFAGDSANPFSHITIEGFDAGQAAQIKGAIGHLFTTKCADAYHNAHLRSPEEVVSHDGLVVRPSFWLGEKTAQDLGLVSDETRIAYRDEFYTGTAYSSSQGGTIPAFSENGTQLTTDGRTQMYLHTRWAFNGDSFLDRTFSLGDLMAHEFIHASPTGRVWGRLGRFRHDLAGFAPHDAILAACR